jgi:alkylation response protein AidB-like acyl-CoA dehydrogenase
MANPARFFQDPPTLGDGWRDDVLLRGYLESHLAPSTLEAVRGELEHLGALGSGELYAAQRADLEHEPRLVQWDAWGHRVDHIELTPLWHRAKGLTAEHGLVATAYDTALGADARLVHLAKNHLVQPSLDVWSCPLAMTDGATRTLLDLGNVELIERAVPRLTARDPALAWTSGQWMTERTGGSDVGRSETVARPVTGADGRVEGWRLHGVKWFTSATTSEMALTLARPEGHPEGSRGLALFYLELRDADGRLQNLEINRLKDKLGTRKVPTAELTLSGVPATPVAGLFEGVKKITSMLNVTRLWNTMAAAWGMRRAVALATAYARRRVAFGALLAEKPLHRETLFEMIAETDGASIFAMRLAGLVGRMERGLADERELELVRVLTPIAKLTTGKQGVRVTSEALEAFGGAGYVEDTGLPRMLADAQVLPIWEGTTNVLSLDTLRALAKGAPRDALADELRRALRAAEGPAAGDVVAQVEATVRRAFGWLEAHAARPAELEAGARGFALTMGRCYEAALLLEHAARRAERPDGPRALAVARRFVAAGLDQLVAHPPVDPAWIFGA